MQMYAHIHVCDHAFLFRPEAFLSHKHIYAYTCMYLCTCTQHFRTPTQIHRKYTPIYMYPAISPTSTPTSSQTRRQQTAASSPSAQPLSPAARSPAAPSAAPLPSRLRRAPADLGWEEKALRPAVRRSPGRRSRRAAILRQGVAGGQCGDGERRGLRELIPCAGMAPGRCAGPRCVVRKRSVSVSRSVARNPHRYD